MFSPPIKILALGLSISLSSVASENDKNEFTQLSRYTKINVNSEMQQRNPLKTIVSMKFPPSIKTVGQALSYSLDMSGYTIPNSKGLTKETRILMSRKLPRIHQEFKFVTMENLLKTLSGNAYTLLIDPIEREVNFVANIDY